MNIEKHNPDVIDIDMSEIAGQWGWLLLLGILTIITGCFALVLPQLATLTTALLVGCLLIIDGSLQALNFFRLRRKNGFRWRLVGAVLSIVVGLMLLLFPLEGILSLTLVIGAFFVAAGTVKAVLAFQIRPMDSWGWLLFSALVSILLGALVLFLWPGAAGWVIGVLVGVDLIFAGWWLVILAIAARKYI